MSYRTFVGFWSSNIFFRQFLSNSLIILEESKEGHAGRKEKEWLYTQRNQCTYIFVKFQKYRFEYLSFILPMSVFFVEILIIAP